MTSNPANVASEGLPEGLAVPEPPMVRWLKFAVIAMGIMIVVGLLVVIGRIVYLASNPPRQGSSASAGTYAGGRIAPAATLAVPAGSVIRQISLSGDRLAIHYEGTGGSAVAIVELATGSVLSRVQIVPEVPR